MSRILFVLNTYPGQGGVETVTTNLIRGFGQYCAEHSVYVLAYDKVPGMELPGNVRKTFYFTEKSRSRISEANVALYNKIIADYGITHVINQGMYPFLTNIVLNDSMNPDVKVISCLHAMPSYLEEDYWSTRAANSIKKLTLRLLCHLGLNFSYNRFMKKYIAGYRKAAEKGTKVVLLCNDYIEEFCSLYNIPEKFRNKICAIPNPLSQEYSERMADKVLDNKENILLYVGRLSYEKNPSLIVDAWKLLQDRMPDWKFLIVGDGPLRTEIEHKISRENIRRIKMEGFTQTPSEYYRKAKILILASKYEGFTMVLLEAQRFGVIPVAYPCSAGVGSIISDGGGIGIESLSASSIASAVCQAASSDLKMRDLAESALAKSRNWELPAIVSRWMNLLS